MTESRFVIDDRVTPRFRVHRSAMFDPEVLEQERRLVFDRSWLFVGHESEIPDPHDFRTRRVGGRPVIFTRSTDRAVQVFVNSCPHRGMQIEARPQGHGRFLKCFYHGWSFNTSGSLVAMPDEASYGEKFDRENLCLARPPKLGSYRGFVFLAWSDDVGPLEDYLAGACDLLDLIADQSEVGMKVISGTHLYSVRANWKLLSENSYDGYHAVTTHHRYLAMLQASGKDVSVLRSGTGIPSVGWDLGNGHACLAGADGSGGRTTALGRDYPPPALTKQVARRDRMAALYGEDWANRMFSGRNVVIFPNLAIIDLTMGITIRTYYPIAPDFTEITAWSLQPIDDEPELRQMRQENFLTFWGPAGLATPDDVEALERCQQGFAAADIAPWSDISRGMVRDHPGGFDELQMRVFWREWDRRLTGTVHDPEIPVSPRAGRAALPPRHRREVVR